MSYPFVVPTDWSTNGYTIGEDFCPLSVRRRKKGDEAATAETALELCRHSDQLTFIPEILARSWCNLDKMREIRVADWPPVEKEIFLTVKADRVPRQLVDVILKSIRQ
jgi:DNA-binding transcriptional LysR family regulator